MMTGNSIFCAAQSLGGVAHGLPAAGKNRNAGPLGDGAGRNLVAELLQQFRPRPDEDDAGRFTGAGQLGVLGKEAVARVNRVDTPLFRQGDEGWDVEIGADRLAGLADQVGLVRLQPMQGEPVFVGIDADGADAQLVAGPEDPDSNFTAIGDQKSRNAPH